MNPLRFASGFERSTKRTAKQQFLEEMLAVVPWDASRRPDCATRAVRGDRSPPVARCS